LNLHDREKIRSRRTDKKAKGGTEKIHEQPVAVLT